MIGGIIDDWVRGIWGGWVRGIFEVGLGGAVGLGGDFVGGDLGLPGFAVVADPLAGADAG